MADGQTPQPAPVPPPGLPAGYDPNSGTIPQWAEYAKPGPYTTTLAPEEENKFQEWVHENHIPWQDTTTADYDMRGYWKSKTEGNPDAHTAIDPVDKRPHYPDTWKTPYHKTFSNQSQYALPTAGHWEGETFVPPAKKLDFSSIPDHKEEPIPTSTLDFSSIPGHLEHAVRAKQ